jgi:SAM-dependent methyltransferase
LTIANVEQAAAWDGSEGAHWAEHADRYERAGWRHQQWFDDAGLIVATDRVLDIGCGTGKSTRDAARQAAQGSALGVDLSAQMLDRGRERAAAEGVTNVEFLQADAQVHPFDAGAFDIAISSFGCMFFGDPVAAFANIATALRPGGRVALFVWRELARNEWLTAIRGAVALGRELPTPPPDSPGHPFSLADPDRVRSILGASGYDRIELEPVDEPVDMGADADDAFAFFSTNGMVRWLLEGVDDAGRARAMDNLRAAFEAAATPDGVLLGSSAWVITATRR